VVSILGISAFYHDSAACLVVDGDIVAAAQEERFSRVKHDHRFPFRPRVIVSPKQTSPPENSTSSVSTTNLS
jgi:predicted NodU family carbamoyl transferase